MQYIPIQAVPNQTVQVLLDGQATQIDIRKTCGGLFVDLLVDEVPIVTGVIAQNLNRIVRSTYLGFAGDLVFYDTQGSSDPEYTGLGTRWLLCYLTATEAAA